ncbi:hypothetical protein NKG94_26210 [Micromonospora sp. M12]
MSALTRAVGRWTSTVHLTETVTAAEAARRRRPPMPREGVDRPRSHNAKIRATSGQVLPPGAPRATIPDVARIFAWAGARALGRGAQALGRGAQALGRGAQALGRGRRRPGHGAGRAPARAGE